MKNNTVIIIPARLAATRLPNKPLLKIAGREMILHVLERAMSANVAEVYVACCSEEIAGIVTSFGGKAVITDPNLPSGTDRVYAGLLAIEGHERFTNIINLQGDMPNFNPEIIIKTVEILEKSNCDIATVASPCTYGEALKESVVKPVFGSTAQGFAKALYFSRNLVPHNATQYYHHIGIYGYRRAALEKFVNLPVSQLEQHERLEQLRALEHGMNINISVVQHTPISVDTPDDLTLADSLLSEEVIALRNYGF
ncbi:3-deoxy-manno-octulosonate cytidylyltransferase [Rickettsiales endosymbiont of Stachyamoeba lipophora]|nr:3-deoxy-manno-octulosonate cytidylyltransferase [Rickettsiales endosymbiont of Stachyamoeba lipophora]